MEKRMQFKTGISKLNMGLFGFIVILGMMVGGFIVSYIFFGMMTLIGFIALVESIRPLKWFVERASSLIDVIIFFATLTATFELGVTITATLTVAGLGFTLLYAPYLRARYRNKKNKRKNNKYYESKEKTKDRPNFWHPYKKR